jgi:hypothetical protein
LPCRDARITENLLAWLQSIAFAVAVTRPGCCARKGRTGSTDPTQSFADLRS